MAIFPTVPEASVPWLSVPQMREVDRLMTDELGVSLVRMMENAGRSLALLSRTLLGGDAARRDVVVLAGPGGNGGGGLVAARHLISAGAGVRVHLSSPPDELAPVTAEQLSILERMGTRVVVGAAALGRPELALDCLLGYGQRGAPEGRVRALIEASARLRTVALDVPSGLELETGVLHAPHVRAAATLTLALPKEGLRASRAETAVGALYLADISVPALVIERLGLPYQPPFGSSTIVALERS